LKIELYILLPAATFFVLLLIGFIRLLTGARNAQLTKVTCTEFFNIEEPDVSISNIIISEDNSCALIITNAKKPFFLIRPHGDKLVLQALPENLSGITQIAGNALKFPRLNIAHPPAILKLPDNAQNCDWFSTLKVS